MAKHEQSVIDSFNMYFQRQAAALGRQARSFSLDGQDVAAGADYILTDHSRFSLVEFKYTQNEIFAESDKTRRLDLCKELARLTAMKALHDKCHFIAWADKPSLKAQLNIYRLEVCNQVIFGADKGLTEELPSIDSRIFAKQFTTEFFSETSSRSLSLTEFEFYVQWLLGIDSGNTKSSFELLTYDDASEECAMIELSSIRAAYNWMQRQSPSQGLTP